MNVEMEQILKYFEIIDKINADLGDFGRKTRVGYFHPSNLRYLAIFFQELLDKGDIDSGRYLADAGCGMGEW